MTTRTLINSVIVSVALASVANITHAASKSETVAPKVVSTHTELGQPTLKTNTIESLVAPITNNVILPLYKEADRQAQLLNMSTLAFCQQPSSESLSAIRYQWSQALSAWQASEVALFGPGLEKQRDLHIYFRPVKKRVIKQLWAKQEPITLDSVNFAGVGAKGFATLEYLLLDRSLTDLEVLARFNTPANTPHCQHLLAVSILLKNDINAIYTAWATDYPATLTESGQAMSSIIGKLDQTAESVSTKLRQALAKDAHLAGKDEKREKRNAHKLEAWRSGHTLQNIRANLSGVKLVLNDGGLVNWLSENNHSELANIISKQLTVIDTISFKSTDLFQQIENGELDAADKLFQESLKLSRLIKEMAAVMGVQLGFNDSDGD